MGRQGPSVFVVDGVMTFACGFMGVIADFAVSCRRYGNIPLRSFLFGAGLS
jgi:hypothetical protein